YETSVFGECTEDRQRESVHPVFSNVTSEYRQSKWLKYLNSAHCDLITQNSNDTEVTDDTSAENVLGMLTGDTGESQSSTVNNSAPGSVPLLTAKSTLGECCAHSSNEDLISERKLLSLHLNQTPLTEPAQKVLSHLTCRTVTGDVQGRAFYACDAPRAERCSFFQWVEEVNPAQIKKIRPSVVLHDVKSIGTYLQSQKIFVFDGCQLLVRKGYEIRTRWCGKLEKFMNVHAESDGDSKNKLYLKLNRKEHYSLYSKDCNLKMNLDSEKPTRRINKRKFIPPAMSLVHKKMYGSVSAEVAMELAEKMILTFSLNPDQATSLIHIAQMMASQENMKAVDGRQIFPITIIHGVFGAGKSYLLSVVILFLVQLFERSEAKEDPELAPWKLLVASSTNVAVDRVLLCLLDLGFEDFIRVGSIRKIAKAILPYSLHAGSGNENEQLKELLALMKENLAPAEKMYVRKSIERHKLGTNKTALQQVKVVGVTCAACPFPCLSTLKFPVVVLDECSQMTEPASLLPIARFQCEKLVLVGDPKQLPPTIQGSESVHEKGLEQTLFDRLCLMGHKTILLRTQYRCHPAISAIANELFYEGNLIDGVSEKERSPLLDWLPTLCFYSVNGLEQTERDNSFYNMAEVHFTVKLIKSLIASGIDGSAVGVITFYKSQMCKVCTMYHQ
ncbi:UNVERIFIED_CONTAM: hypothetical protein H355_015945, partial [Colinus virginianus]